ncbi:putative reticulocyte binding protein 5 [Encephalitozoon hellem]|uniref:Reticulocyte binding protein 5 n=1 Tax=Encephalitozoon hellem TaxID=27973 RepID=A0ABY8CII6_ENCHE|nr:putative reticulocyte binding protein 5 [Encephalitozoon hellem]
MELLEGMDLQELSEIGNQIVSHKHSTLLAAYYLLMALKSLLGSLSYGSEVQFSFVENIKETFTDKALFDKEIAQTIKKTESSIDELLNRVEKWEDSIGFIANENLSLPELQNFEELGSSIYPYFIFAARNPKSCESGIIWEKLRAIAAESRKTLDIYSSTDVLKKLLDIGSEMLRSEEVRYLTEKPFLSVPESTPLRLMEGVSEILEGDYNEWIFPYFELCGILSLLRILTSPF